MTPIGQGDEKYVSQCAYQDLHKYRKEGLLEIDFKAELEQELMEKYESIR